MELMQVVLSKNQMNYKHVILDIKENIATLTLNRPEKLNEITKR